jgi:hypothetical protein
MWRALALWQLAAVVLGAHAAAWPAYRKLAKSDAPYAPVLSKATSLAAAAAACSADPACKAYNSDGELKACAGCEGGSDCCVYPAGAMDFPPADRVDLFVKTGAAPPSEWAAGIAAGSVLYAQPEPDICMMPEVGNGYVASIIGFSSMHVSGFFNGGCGGVSKAHLPSVVGINATNADTSQTQSALDMKRAVYVQRLHIDGSVVEQRTYAHRVRKHILVTEFELLLNPAAAAANRSPPAAVSAAPVTLNLTTLFDPLCGPPPPAPPAPPAPAFNGTYLKVTHDSGGNGHDVGSLPECVAGQCPVEKLRHACDINPKCDLFQTHGFLKQCSGGGGGTPTNKTTACQPRTPWPTVDSYYKIRTPPAAAEAEVSAVGDDPADATAPPSGGGGAGFGQGQACGTAGNGCAGSFKRDVYFERLSSGSVLPSDVTVFRGELVRDAHPGHFILLLLPVATLHLPSEESSLI